MNPRNGEDRLTVLITFLTFLERQNSRLFERLALSSHFVFCELLIAYAQEISAIIERGNCKARLGLSGLSSAKNQRSIGL